MPLTLGAVFGEAWELYRLLMRRSILTAFLVFAVVDAVAALSDLPDSTPARVGLDLLSFVLTFSGPVVVQGALIHIVHKVHEGRPPERIPALIREAGRTFWSLIGASILYGLGVFFGLLLLIMPGVIVAARWCLLAPLIMLEGQFVQSARERSADLARGRTATVALDVRLGGPYGRGLMPLRRAPSGSSGGSPAAAASTAWRHSRTISAPTRSAASA